MGVQWSINYTVQGYLALGVPPSKMMVGLAMYGHTWYSPGLDNWQVMGGPSQKQSKCFGPFKDTYGAKPGKGCNQCGVMMFSGGVSKDICDAISVPSKYK